MAPEEVTRDVLSKTFSKGSRYWRAVALLSLLFVGGIVGFALRFGDDRSQFGYYAATFAFLFTAGQTAPLVSVALRMAKNHWRRPLARASELFAVVGLFNLIIFIPLMMILPSIEGRHTIWIDRALHDRPEFYAYSPHIFDTLGMVGLVLCGLGLLWVGAIPDFASARDQRGGRGLYSRLALGFHGTVRQWRIQRGLLGFLGAFYFMAIMWTHFLISTDFSMGLVPGWVDSIYATFHALTGLQAALASVLIAMYMLRTIGGYGEYLPMESFWGLSKILLATSLLWFYFWWSGFFLFWYGRMPSELSIIELVMFGPYIWAFIVAFLFSVIFAVALLIWNPIRKSPGALAGISTMILIGLFFDRIRLYVSSWSVEDSTAHELHVPDVVVPGLPDILIIIGFISGAILMYLLAARLIPVISIWEMRELRLYQVRRKFLRREVVSLGKPE